MKRCKLCKKIIWPWQDWVKDYIYDLSDRLHVKCYRVWLNHRDKTRKYNESI